MKRINGCKQKIIDELLDAKLEVFGATLIVSPKGCGKTTKKKAQSIVTFQDPNNRDELLRLPSSHIV